MHETGGDDPIRRPAAGGFATGFRAPPQTDAVTPGPEAPTWCARSCAGTRWRSGVCSASDGSCTFTVMPLRVHRRAAVASGSATARRCGPAGERCGRLGHSEPFATGDGATGEV